jgi:hypothetical protein
VLTTLRGSSAPTAFQLRQPEGDMPDEDPVDQDAETSNYEHRTLVNLLAAVVLLLLAIGAAYVLTTMDRQWKLERCLASGRRDCAPLQVLPGTVRNPVR